MSVAFKRWWSLPQKLRFLLAGAYNTAFGYLLFAALYYALHTTIGYLGVAVLCQPISLASAFIVHRRLVFKSTDRWTSSFLRFILSQLAAFVYGLIGLYSLVNFARLNPLLAQGFIVVTSVLITFTLHRRFSFRSTTQA